MIRRATPLLLAAAALAACAPQTPAPAVPGPVAAETGGPTPEFPPVAPVPGPAPALRPPSPEVRTLSNGMRVMYVRQAELPVVHATVVARGAGSSADPAELPGLAGFTASLMDEGAGGRSALEVADALDLLGANLWTSAGWDAAEADLYVLRKNFPEALRILSDVVVRPGFPADEVARKLAERITSLERGRDLPGVIAANAFQALTFGSSHPYGRFGTVAASRRMDAAALAGFHATRWRPENTTLVLVGDVDPSLHGAVEAAFGGWRAEGAARPVVDVPAPPELGQTAIHLVDKPGAAQSEIRIGHPGVARSHPDYFPLVVMNTLLGGSFTSRLNTNLRETHGYSYGAGSSFAMRRGVGPFTAASAVVTAKTDSALIQFFHELRRIRDQPVPADELERAKRYVALGYPQNFETSSAVASQLSELVQHEVDPSFFATYVDRVMAVTAEDVARVAREHVRPDRAVVVVVGDRATIEEAVRATGLGPVHVRQVSEFVM